MKAIKPGNWGTLDRVLLASVSMLLVILLSAPAKAQGCNDPCEYVQMGQCNCDIDYDYYGAIGIFGCCCGWWICWQGVNVESPPHCSSNCNDDVYMCVQPSDCGV
jgi:hypothetical protein